MTRVMGLFKDFFITVAGGSGFLAFNMHPARVFMGDTGSSGP